MLYQYGSMTGLMGKALGGEKTMKELLEYGDFGIGTFNGIDGEVIIFDGQVYKVDFEGKASISDLNGKTPFANITKFEPKFKKEISSNFKSLLENLEEYVNPNYFYAIKITGSFEEMKTRVAKKHDKPYPTLLEVTKTQSNFNYKNTDGIVVGFFFPKYTQLLTGGEFHLHYLSNDKTQGGHIFDFNFKNALVEISKPLNFFLESPITEEYENLDIDLNALQKEIHAAESAE